MNSIGILEGVKMLMMITTNFVESLHENAIDQRWHQVKGMMKRKVIGTMGTTQYSKSSLLFKEKWYNEEDRRKISSPSKFVLREEPDSTVKKLHDNDIADKARNDLKG